jgi:hypothetical protein
MSIEKTEDALCLLNQLNDRRSNDHDLQQSFDWAHSNYLRISYIARGWSHGVTIVLDITTPRKVFAAQFLLAHLAPERLPADPLCLFTISSADGYRIKSV